MEGKTTPVRLFDFLRKGRKAAESAGEGPPDRAQIFYHMAYRMLPQILFTDPDRLVCYFEGNGAPAGPFLYLLFCTAHGIEPDVEDAKACQAHRGELNKWVIYYAIEFPRPRKEVIDPTRGHATLSPYFCAILQTRADRSFQYYTLGQRPFGGTTLRTVTPDGTNANLGEGPTPELPAFLTALRDHLENPREVQASIRVVPEAQS